MGFNMVSIVMVLFTLELFVVEGMLCYPLKRRAHFNYRYIVGMLVILVYAGLLPMEYTLFWEFFGHLSIFFLTLVKIYFCYEETVLMVLFVGIEAYTIQHISSLINSMITLLAPERLHHLGPNWGSVPLVLLMIIVCDVVVFGIAYLALIRRTRGENLPDNMTVPVIVLSVCMLFVNRGSEIYADEMLILNGIEILPKVELMQYLSNFICCILCLCVQFGIFSRSRVEQELIIAKRIASEKEQQYKNSKCMMDTINRKSHNLKYQLAALSVSNDSQKQLQDAVNLVDTFDSEIVTGNEILDVVFAEKNYYCQKHDISFVCMIDGARLGFMDVTDIYILFGNILDNAVHAVRNLTERERRAIYVDVHTEKKLLLISTENCFSGELEFYNGLPKTSTRDELNHGFGMVSIRMICEKYGGSVTARAEKGVFYLNIVIPL